MALPFDNQTGRAEFDWISPLLPAALNAQTAGSANITIQLVRTMADARLERPTSLLRGYVTIENNKLTTRAVLSDAETGAITKRFTASGEPLAVAAKLAADLAQPIRPFTTNAAAAKLLGEALETNSPAETVSILQRAVAADPQFGAAYLPLAQSLAAQGDQQGALAVLRRGAALNDPIARSRIAFVLAGISRNPAEQLEASEALAKLVPAETEPAIQAAAIHHSRRNFKEAIKWYRKALDARPDAAIIWNSAAYSYARAGEFPAALDALAHYARLDPAGANPLDSLGEVQFMAGKFAESSKAFLDSYQKNPVFLRSTTLKKAAIARRMTGDSAAANTLFNKYLDAVSKDPLIPVYRARWQYLSGDTANALAAVKAIAADTKSPPNVAAIASLQTTVWLLQAGDRAGAAAASNSPVAKFLSQPSANSTEWNLRSEAQLNTPALAGVKRLALAYALLFDKQYREASLVLRELYEQRNPDVADSLRELLAWSYVELDKWDEAGPLLVTWPLPETADDETFDCLIYPRAREIRALASKRRP